jgi:hypothetical protein
MDKKVEKKVLQNLLHEGSSLHQAKREHFEYLKIEGQKL